MSIRVRHFLRNRKIHIFPEFFGGHRLAPVLGALGHGDAPLVLDLRRRGPELAAGVRPRRGTEGMQAL